MNLTQNAIISVLHQEPWYRFVSNERKAAEGMVRLGWLKPLNPSARQLAQEIRSALTVTGKQKPGKFYSVTKKGEEAYMINNAHLNILSKSWSMPIIQFLNPLGSENVRIPQTVGLVSLDVSPFEVEGFTGVWIARIKTPEAFRRQGHAARAMKLFLNECLYQGVDVYLAINAYGGMSFNQLFKWYQRLGFEQIKNKEKGFMRFACSLLFRKK